MPRPTPPTRDRLMSQSGDAWYVRFPDGRVKRAANTNVLRRQLHSGRVPYASTVRRSPDQEWVTLEWTEEFADLVKKGAAANGTKPPPIRATVVHEGKEDGTARGDERARVPDASGDIARDVPLLVAAGVEQ